MSSQSIHPYPEGLSPTNPCIVYAITASHALPFINVARSIRSVWFHGDVEQAYMRFTKRWKLVIVGGFNVGLAAFWIVLIVPAQTGRWIALVASVPTLFTCTAYFSLLRYDVVCLVVRTYEFWFFSVGNVVSAMLLAIYMRDLRGATMAVFLWLNLQNNILTDANTVFTKAYLSAAIGVLLFTLFLIVTIAFGIIDQAHEVELLRLGATRRLLIQEALIHGYSTQAIMIARNIYRRWTTPTRPHARSHSESVATIVCVTLHARLQLHRIDDGTPNVLAAIPCPRAIVPQTPHPMVVQLRLVPVSAYFPVDQPMGFPIPPINSSPRLAIRSVLLAAAYVGLSFAVVAAVAPNLPYINEIRVVALVCSVIFVGCSSRTIQRQLLRRLVLSFDFAFLSIQLLVVHICLCDILGWGYAALPIATIWLWIQWVLTSDAVTPIVKATWSIRRRLPSIIMLVFIVGQLLIFAAIVLENTTHLRNRVVVSLAIRGHVLEMKVIPMLVSRLVILFGWSWKVLWRMWTIRNDELLMIQGTMTYVHAHRRPIIKTATIPVGAAQ